MYTGKYYRNFQFFQDEVGARTKSPATSKPKEVKPSVDKTSRTVTKQASTRNVAQNVEKPKSLAKVRTDSTVRITKQASDRSLKTIERGPKPGGDRNPKVGDRSLKEKNEKPKSKKLDLDHKTKSETAIKQTKRVNAYQRRATDQVKPRGTLDKTDSRIFDKENRQIGRKRLSETACSPQKPSPAKSGTPVTPAQSVPVATSRPQKSTPTAGGNGDGKAISATAKSTSQPQIARKTSKTSRDSVAKTASTPQKPAPKTECRPATVAIPIINTKQPKSKERRSSISASSESSVSQSDLNELGMEERVTEVRKTRTVTATETKEPHLNVIVRMPSSSRETTPNKQGEDCCTVTDDEGVPRYADRVIMPEDAELVDRRTVTNLRFEKITDLDEESETEMTNVSVAERMNKFLESAKDTTTKQTVVEDDLFQNREQAVSKTKEIFESIAKSQAPAVARPPPVVSRPSVFEQKRIQERVSKEEHETQEGPELGHDGPHRVVSRILTDKDYQDYLKESAQEVDENVVSGDCHVTRIAQNFETRTRANDSTVDVKTKSVPEKPERREVSPTKNTEAPVLHALPGPRQPLFTKISLTSLNTTEDSESRRKIPSPSKDVDNRCQPQYIREGSPVKEDRNRPASPQSRQTTIKTSTAVKKISLSELNSETESDKPAAEQGKHPNDSRSSSPSKDAGYSRRTASSTYKEREKSSSPTKELHTKQFTPPTTATPSSRQNSPTKDSRTKTIPSRDSPVRETKKRPISPPSRRSSPTKEARVSTPTANAKRTSPTKETSSKKRPSSPPSKRTSPEKEAKKPSSARPTSPPKEARPAKRPTSRDTTTKTSTIQSTIQRYENNSKSPPRKLKPIEIIQVEVKPSKQVYEHTAVTNVHAYSSRHAPIQETFNQTLTRTSDDRVRSTVTRQTESSKRKTDKSPSPEKQLPADKRPRKSPSPSRDTKRATVASYETRTTSQKRPKSPSPEKKASKLRPKSLSPEKKAPKLRPKSPSPEKKASKLRNKFQTTSEGETKRKPFEKRISTTGHDYQNRKQFFETKSRQELRGRNTEEDRSSITTTANTSGTKRSPERQVGQKSEIRKISQETTTAKGNRGKPAFENNVNEFGGPQASQTKRKSPERGPDGKRKSPEKTTATKKSTPFGVTLRKTSPSAATTTSAFSTIQKTTATAEDENEKRIEEIFDLEVLEKMVSAIP